VFREGVDPLFMTRRSVPEGVDPLREEVVRHSAARAIADREATPIDELSAPLALRATFLLKGVTALDARNLVELGPTR
jgi:hypothetical protein